MRDVPDHPHYLGTTLGLRFALIALTGARPPLPRSVKHRDGWLNVTGRFQVEWVGFREALLERAVARLQCDVTRRSGIDIGRAIAVRLRIACQREDRNYLTIDARERYSLSVTADVIVLTADGPAGMLRGLATLRQAITNTTPGFAIPVMSIDDARFAWRSLMIELQTRVRAYPAKGVPVADVADLSTISRRQ